MHALCLQEVRADHMAQTTAKTIARKRGFTIHFGLIRVSDSNAIVNGLATIFRWGCAISALAGVVDGKRQLAVQIPCCKAPITLVNVHAKYDWPNHVYDKWAQDIWKLPGYTIAIGDWNRRPDQSPVANWMVVNEVVCSDAPSTWAESTVRGPDSHYDYALHKNAMPFRMESRTVMDGIDSDHKMVLFTIKGQPPAPTYTLRPRVKLPEFSPNQEVDGELFREIWDEHFESQYQQAKNQGDSEKAYECISRAAEETLLKAGINQERVPGDTENPQWKQGHFRRHEIPKVIQNADHGKMPGTSVAYRRIVTLWNRRAQLEREPDNMPLFRNCLKSYALCQEEGDVGEMTGSVLDDLAKIEKVRECMAEEQQARIIQKWEIAMRDDDRFSAWIRKDEQIDFENEILTDVAEVSRLNNGKALFKALWNATERPEPAVLKPLVDKHARKIRRPCVHDCNICGKQTKRQFNKIAGKAKGTDDWAAALLAQMPEAWHDILADYVNWIAHNGKDIPQSWRYTFCRLIPKPTGGKRPISIASAVWRAVTHCQLSCISEWIKGWLPSQICGGVPGRSGEELLERIDRFIEDTGEDSPMFMGAIDLVKCFDSISPEMAIQTAKLIGLPAPLVNMLESFYKELWVLFRTGSTTDTQFDERTYGLLHGDAFSNLLLAIIMAIWSEEVSESKADFHGCFVDDRVIATRSPQRWQEAVRITEEFDAMCKFKWNLGKGVMASSHVETMKEQLGHWQGKVGKVVHATEYLGVEFDLTKHASRERNSTRARMDDAKMDRELRRIRTGAESMQRRRRMVNRHTRPKLAYGASYVTYSDQVAEKIARKIEMCTFAGKRYPSRSVALTWQLVIGPQLHPAFIRDFECVKARIRSLRRKDLAISGVRGRAPREEPLAITRMQDVCTKWMWTQRANNVIETPECFVSLTDNSHGTLEKMAIKGWMRHMLGRESRGTTGTKAIDKFHLDFRTHDEWAHSGKPIQVMAAVGATPDARTIRANLACFCGGSDEPTRDHWTWECNGAPGATPESDNKLTRRLLIPMIPINRKVRLEQWREWGPADLLAQHPG